MRKSVFISSTLAVVTLFVVACNNESNEPAAATTNKEDSLKAVVDRGNYLVNNVTVCLACHSERDHTKFAMPVKPGTEGGGPPYAFGQGMGIPGEITPPNITPFALKDWSDDEIIRALTQGINKKGDTLFPLMPYHGYSRMAKGDIQAIVAYVRTLKPIEKTTPPRKLVITAAMFPPLPQNTLEQNTRPDPSDKIKYGEYLVTAGSCGDCHTPMTPQGPDFSKVFSGGFKFVSDFVNVMTSNITPDSATGIGAWTENEFVTKFKTNLAMTEKGEDPGKFNTEMPWSLYAKMKEEDLRAIYAYLRTVPPIKNKVEKWPTK